MRAAILFLLIALLSSCSLFRNKTVTKTKTDVDSTSVKDETRAYIDTGKSLTYERLIMLRPKNEVTTNPGFPVFPALAEVQNLSGSAFSLSGSVTDLKNGTSGLADQILNHPGYEIALYEKWSDEKKGISDYQAKRDSSSVKKSTEEKIKESSASKLWVACVSVIIGIIALLAFFWPRK